MSIFKSMFGKKKESKQTSSGKPRFYVPDFDKYVEFGQIVAIFDYTLNPDFALAIKGAEAVNRLFKSVQVLKNKQLYETFRYLHINKADIKSFGRFDKELEITLLCIASMNGNGYSREEALNRLIKLQTQRTIPFILFRLSDWVKPIRKKAEKAIATFLVEENTIYFIQNHKLLSWLLRVERTDLSELYNQIINSVISKQLNSEQLKELCEGDRFFYYKSFANAGLLDSKMINQMLSDKYYLIRVLLIKHLDRVDDFNVVLVKLLSDKSQKVRQGAVNLIANQDIYEYETVLKSLIFDNSASIRIEARRLLSKIAKYDFKKLYLENISKEQFIVGSILGISEVADHTEIPLLQKYLLSEKVKIRTASLIGIYNLDTEKGIAKAYQILETDNPATTKRAAEMILLKQGVDFVRLRKLFDSTDIIGKKIILRLFNRYSGWSVAGDFLKALTVEDEQLQLMARVFLDSWNNFTIRLATKQSQEDKDYVLSWYKKIKAIGIQLPGNIPFIFGEK